MDVREKLVELLTDNLPRIGNLPKCDNPLQYTMDEIVERIADHLIAHGVTVQECGHWKIIMDDYDCEMMCCSVCGSEFYDGDNDTVDCLHNYCPRCGTKMMPQPPKGE